MPATHCKSSCFTYWCMRASTEIMQGTLPFRSNQSLKGEPVEYHHDLQSYFWLAYLITCNCAGPFDMRRDWNREIEICQSGQPITPALINNLAEIKAQGGNWKKVATDHAPSAKCLWLFVAIWVRLIFS
jgi:hypothetical protein